MAEISDAALLVYRSVPNGFVRTDRERADPFLAGLPRLGYDYRFKEPAKPRRCTELWNRIEFLER
jgi:hypothetical protein